MYTPTLSFRQNFQLAFVRMDPENVPAKYEVRNFTCSRHNSDWSFANLQTNLEKGE